MRLVPKYRYADIFSYTLRCWNKNLFLNFFATAIRKPTWNIVACKELIDFIFLLFFLIRLVINFMYLYLLLQQPSIRHSGSIGRSFGVVLKFSVCTSKGLWHNRFHNRNINPPKWTKIWFVRVLYSTLIFFLSTVGNSKFENSTLHHGMRHIHK